MLIFLPFPVAAIAQVVERVLGKDEVSGSIPDSSFIKKGLFV